MREQLKDKKNRTYFVLLSTIAIVIFVMYRNIPVINDGWDSRFFYEGFGGLLGVVKIVFVRYFVVNGRILPTILCSFFEQNDILNDIGSTLVFVLIFHLIAKCVESKNRIFALLFSLAFFMNISTETRVEVYFYAVLFYMYAVLVVLWASKYIDLLYSTGDINLKQLSIIAVNTIIACSWIENVAVGVFVSIFSLACFYLMKYKRILYRHWLIVIIAMLSMVFLLASTLITGTRQVSVGDGLLIDTILLNMNTLYKEIFTNQKILFAGLSIIAAIVVWKNAKHKIFRLLYLILLLSIATINILVFFAQHFITFESYVKFSDLFFYTKPTSLLILIKCILNVIIYFIPIYFAKKFNQLVFLYFAGVFSLVPSILTPGNTGARISSFMVFVVIICYIILACEVLEGNRAATVLKRTSIVMFILGIDIYITAVSGISYKQAIREERMEFARQAQVLGQWDYKQELVLPAFRTNELYVGASFGDNDIHYKLFLNYYGLDERTVIVYE